MKLKSLTIITATTILLTSCNVIKSLYSPSEANTAESAEVVVEAAEVNNSDELVEQENSGESWTSETEELTNESTLINHPPVEVEPTPATESDIYTPVADTVIIVEPEAIHPDTTIVAELPAKDPVSPKLVINTEYSKKLAGEWLIINVGDHSIDRDEDMPYIVFQPESAQFYANNGCNTINGQFAVSADNVITFSNTLSTMMYCPDVVFEHEINVIIGEGSATRFKITETDAETLLDFLGEDNQSIMQLRRANQEFLNGRWQVVTIAGFENIAPVSEIFIDTTELKVHGTTGCNYFNGELYLDHRQSNAIDFSNMIVTTMACENMEQEGAMLVALEQTVTVRLISQNTIALLDEEGNQLMTLNRLPIETK